ncbi:hypothetical protein B0H14DRAFT_655896 [Mycena olivaceomarginata]|nr:hypothetical protein B0H14DRAFT_655896 [Mycena olivaceomarginata]
MRIRLSLSRRPLPSLRRRHLQPLHSRSRARARAHRPSLCPRLWCPAARSRPRPHRDQAQRARARTRDLALVPGAFPPRADSFALGLGRPSASASSPSSSAPAPPNRRTTSSSGARHRLLRDRRGSQGQKLWNSFRLVRDKGFPITHHPIEELKLSRLFKHGFDNPGLFHPQDSNNGHLAVWINHRSIDHCVYFEHIDHCPDLLIHSSPFLCPPPIHGFE